MCCSPPHRQTALVSVIFWARKRRRRRQDICYIVVICFSTPRLSKCISKAFFARICMLRWHFGGPFWGPRRRQEFRHFRLEASIRQVLSGSVSRSFPPGLLFSDFGFFGGRKLAVKLKIHKYSSLRLPFLCCLLPFLCCQTA